MIITKTYHCLIKGDKTRTFKFPVFSDVKKIMNGYGPLPASEGVSKEVNWGEKNGYRIMLGFGKEFCKETIIEKIPDQYWKYELTDFKNSSFFFITKVQGEIWIDDAEYSMCKFTNKYSFYNRNIITLPLTFLFVHLLWGGLQKKALKNIKSLIENEN